MPILMSVQGYNHDTFGIFQKISTDLRAPEEVIVDLTTYLMPLCSALMSLWGTRLELFVKRYVMNI